MNKTKKGFLTVSSILTIIAVGISILLSIFWFFMGSIFSEDMVKQSYIDDSQYYTYHESADGGYFFTYIEDGQEMIITDDEVQMITKIASTFGYAMGVGTLVFAVAKFVLAIKILVVANKEKFPKGYVIALLVLSVLSFNILESVFLIIAMSIQNSTNVDSKPLGLNDIEVNSTETEIKE